MALKRCVRRCANFLLLPELYASLLHTEQAKRVEDEKEERFYCLYDVIEYGGRARDHNYRTNHRDWSAGVLAWKQHRAALIQLLASKELNMHKGYPKVK